MNEFFIWPNYQIYKDENYAYIKETESIFLNSSLLEYRKADHQQTHRLRQFYQAH